MVGLYASQGVDLGGVAPSRKVEWHSMESGLSRKNSKATLENLQKSLILSVPYKCMKLNWIELYYHMRNSKEFKKKNHMKQWKNLNALDF